MLLNVHGMFDSTCHTLNNTRTALRAYSCGVCMSSVTSCVGGGWFPKRLLDLLACALQYRYLNNTVTLHEQCHHGEWPAS
jgi:hypothetical protein